jgi:hypothetical protein
MTELHLLAMSVLMGAVLSLAYGVLGIGRRILRHGWLWVGIEDFLYWIFAGFAVFYLLYRENDGALRMYVIAVVLAVRGICNRILRLILGKVLKMTKRCFKINPKRRNI